MTMYSTAIEWPYFTSPFDPSNQDLLLKIIISYTMNLFSLGSAAGLDAVPSLVLLDWELVSKCQWYIL